MKKLFFLVVCALALVLTLSACLDGGDGVTYDISDDGTYATVVGYVGTDTKVEIADTYEGVPVVEIYEGAFQYKKIIKDEKTGKITVEKGNDGNLGMEIDINIINRKD